MDRLQMIEAFLLVVEAGSFAAAADVLGIDRAAATRRVAMLEDALGARLLQRSTRRISLTPEGEAVLADALELRSRAQAFFSKDDGGGYSGVVRVRCSYSLAAFGVVELLEDFARRNPGICIDLKPSEKLRPVVETGADLVLCVDNSPEPGAVAHRLGSCPSCYAASPAYWGSRGRPEAPEDWNGVRLLPAAGEEEWMAGGVRLRMTAENAPIRYGAVWLAYQAALKGEGVAKLPAVAVRNDIAAGRLTAVLPEEPSDLAVWAVLPSSRWIKPAVRALLTELRTRYSRGDAPAPEERGCSAPV